jgi:hypothetical protein
VSYQEDYDLKYGRKGLEWWEYQKGVPFIGPMFDPPGAYDVPLGLCQLEVKALFRLWTTRRINASLHFIPRHVSTADELAQKMWHEATARANALRKILGDEEANKAF